MKVSSKIKGKSNLFISTHNKILHNCNIPKKLLVAMKLIAFFDNFVKVLEICINIEIFNNLMLPE